MSKSKRLRVFKVAAGVVLTLTACGVVVCAFLLPPASPWIAVGGVALATLVASEVIKVAVDHWCSPCLRPTSNHESHETEMEEVHHSRRKHRRRHTRDTLEAPESSLTPRLNHLRREAYSGRQTALRERDSDFVEIPDFEPVAYHWVHTTSHRRSDDLGEHVVRLRMSGDVSLPPSPPESEPPSRKPT